MATFESRGNALWDDLNASQTLSGPARVLAEEACRIADRLERLDGFLRGESREWVTFRENSDGDVKVFVDGALDSARQQALALKQILAELQSLSAGSPVPVKTKTDELAERRAARIANSAG